MAVLLACAWFNLLSGVRNVGGMMSAVAASEQRVEIVGERRRAYNAAFRARVVARSLVPGASV